MSDFIHRVKITELTQSNSELVNEVEQLKDKIQSLNQQIEQLKQENPAETSELKKQISVHEQHEVEL